MKAYLHYSAPGCCKSRLLLLSFLGDLGACFASEAKKAKECSDMPPRDEPSHNGLPITRLLTRETYKGIDKLTILGLFFVFCGLFIWLIKTEEDFFAYLAFLAALTLLLVGFLRGIGFIRSQGFVLGGSAAIFVALFYISHSLFEKYENAKIEDLKNAMQYDETEVHGSIKFDQPDGNAIKISKAAIEIGLLPQHDDIEGPFEGNKYFVIATIPIKKNSKNQTKKIYQKLIFNYPNYFSGCVLLDSSKTDNMCQKISSDGKFQLTLKPSLAVSSQHN